METSSATDCSEHFPAAGNSYRIATDGKCLIIKNVEIQGRLYDVRIWMKDGNGVQRQFKTSDQFLKSTIVGVAQSAAEIFNRIGENLTTTKICFNNTGPLEKKYSLDQEDWIADDEDEDHKTHLLEGNDLNELGNHEELGDVFSHAAKIHSQFFGEKGYYLANSKNEVISPTFELSKPLKPKHKYEDLSEDDLLSEDDPEYETSLKGNFEGDEPVVVDGSTETDEEEDSAVPATATTPASASGSSKAKREYPLNYANELMQEFNKHVDANAFLQGITYGGLKDYSTGLDKNSKYQEPFEAFERLRKNPKSDEPGDPIMLQWLKDVYIKAYQMNLEQKKLHEQERGKRNFIENFDRWCRDRAAYAVAGFVEVDKVPVQPLADELMRTSISSPSSEVPGRSAGNACIVQ